MTISNPSRIPPATTSSFNEMKKNSFKSPRDFFQQIADPIRFDILTLLTKKKELSVTDIIDNLKKPQTLISYHLRSLRELGLVQVAKDSGDSRKNLYSIHAPSSIKQIFELANDYIKVHGNCATNPCDKE